MGARFRISLVCAFVFGLPALGAAQSRDDRAMDAAKQRHNQDAAATERAKAAHQNQKKEAAADRAMKQRGTSNKRDAEAIENAKRRRR